MNEIDSSPEAPLDGIALDRLKSLGGEAFVAQMIDIVLPQVENRLAAAREGLAKGDAGAVRLAVHSMRSTAGNVGAGRLLRAAAAAEDLAAEGQMTELSAAFAEVERAWVPVRSALGERRKSSPE